MYTLAQRLSSNWTLVESLLIAGIGVVTGLILWVMRLGGKQGLLRWIVEIESSEQNDAHQRMMRGCKAFLSVSGTSTACYDFIGGMDQWRAAQMRITQRSNCVRRSGAPICVFVFLAVGALAIRILEPPTHSWSAWCVAGAVITAAWLFWTIFPLVYLAFLKGHPHPTDATATHLDERPASPVVKPPQPVEVKGNASAVRKVDSTRARD